MEKAGINMVLKNRIKVLFKIIFIILFITVSKSSYAEIIEIIDFETGDYSQCSKGVICHKLPKGCMGGVQDSCIGHGRPMKIDSAGIARLGNCSSKHTLYNCAMRSEIRGKVTIIGRTYWYGWSYYIPEDFNQEKYTIVNQMSCYPCNNPLPGDGAGHKLDVKNSGWYYTLQRSDGKNGSEYTYEYLGTLSEGEWTDFAMYAKWTGNENGFLKIWKNGKLKLDYTGRTWWNNEGWGPFFSGGEYKGRNCWATKTGDPEPVIIYLDEIRVGNILSNYAEVRPGHKNLTTPSDLKAITLFENGVLLTWKDKSNNENHFWIERLKDNFHWKGVATVNANLENYIDRIELEKKPPYLYRIAAENQFKYFRLL